MKKVLMGFILGIILVSIASASLATINISSQLCQENDGTYPPYQQWTIPCNNSKVKYLDSLSEYNGYPQATGGFKTINYENLLGCKSIVNVSLCYKWWRETDAQVQFECQIFASNDNGSSWTSASGILNNDCPVNNIELATYQCKDVTNLFNWTCNNFFNPNYSNHSSIMFQVDDAGSESALLWLNVAHYQVTYNKIDICQANATRR